MERKTRFASRCRPLRGVALALFALFGGLATAAQAMLLTLDLRWYADAATLRDTYHLQEGSIVQVIGYSSEKSNGPDDFAANQFTAYGVHNNPTNGAAPYPPTDTSHAPGTPGTVYLANTAQTNHTILYTDTIQDLGSWYGLYTQIKVDTYLYDHVYIRVFGATDIPQGEVTASYWGISGVHSNSPSYATDTFSTNNVVAGHADYFEVIPEPATAGLLGMGGVALAAWRRRRRRARTGVEAPVRMEE